MTEYRIKSESKRMLTIMNQEEFCVKKELFHHYQEFMNSLGSIRYCKAEIFRDSEMTVISRNRTEPFHLIQLAPRRIPHDSVGISA